MEICCRSYRVVDSFPCPLFFFLLIFITPLPLPCWFTGVIWTSPLIVLSLRWHGVMMSISSSDLLFSSYYSSIGNVGLTILVVSDAWRRVLLPLLRDYFFCDFFLWHEEIKMTKMLAMDGSFCSSVPFQWYAIVYTVGAEVYTHTHTKIRNGETRTVHGTSRSVGVCCVV